MNIKDIDLLKMKQTIINSSENEIPDVETINRLIWDINCSVPKKCDVIMVLGNPTSVEYRLPKALELYEEYQPSYILLCGGKILPGKTITEAESMKQACIEAHVPEMKLLLENRSETTQENIIFSASILSEINRGRDHIDVAVVSSATHLRRVEMNFMKYQKLYPKEMKVHYVSSSTGVDKYNWIYDKSICKEVAMEIGFIHEYIYLLDYPLFNF